MTRTPVTSSNLKSVGYDSSERTLEVEFKNGGVYAYSDVSPQKASAFLRAPSLGKYLNSKIKPAHKVSKQ